MTFKNYQPSNHFPHHLKKKQDWPKYWTEMATRLYKRKEPGNSDIENSKEALFKLFSQNPCHPKKISPENLRLFLSTIYRNEHHIFKTIHTALIYLYRHLSIADPSGSHQTHSAIEQFSPSTTDDLVNTFSKNLKMRNRSYQTIKNYSKILSRYLEYLRKMPSINDKHDVEMYLLRLQSNKHYSARTINLHAAVISSFYKNILKTSFASEEIPRMRPGFILPKVYGQGDIKKLIEIHVNKKHLLLIILVYGCGLRLEEIRRLKVADIDWDRQVIRINGKGSKQRDIPIDETFSPYLREHLADNPGLVYVFEGARKGKPYSRRTVQKIYENACNKAKIIRKGGIHSLRHSYATHLLEQGVDINKIKVLLGHSSVKTTQIYTHVSREEILKIRSPLSNIINPKSAGPT